MLYCRPGFEKEAASEIQAQALALGVTGYIQTKPDSGHVLFTPHEPRAFAALSEGLALAALCFARQMIFVAPRLHGLSPTDRIAPLLEAARALAPCYAQVMLETADTNEAKSLAAFLRKFEGPLLRAMDRAGLLDPAQLRLPRLHLFFIDSTTVYPGLSLPGNASPWPMGIPRLKFPKGAPSRSTLKLEEAFLTFLGDPARLLQPGMKAVDLGAAPGGWTWQLARRSIRVAAVDNGPLDQALLESGIVEHIRADGFRYRPSTPVDWLVCDMVEQPRRIADLVARWLAEGLAYRAIFNLKLPMKKRYEEVQRCRALIEERLSQAGVPFTLAFRQLYHDREEVTGYLARRERTQKTRL